MSAAPVRQHRPAVRTAPNTAPAKQPPRRDHLRAVAAPEQARSLAPFAWLCIGIIVAALAAVLLLNTAMASGAYERRDLKIELAELHEQRGALITELEANSSPHLLAATAEDLGMVHAGRFGFVSIENAAVLESDGG